VDGNAERLRNEGLIADQPLPERYYEMIDGLSEEEIEILVSLKRRLDDAGIPTAPLTAPTELGGQKSIVVL
jgi:hypothetical protein